MRYLWLPLAFFLISITVSGQNYQTPKNYIQTKESLSALTPQAALQKLMDGNTRFLNNNMRQRDFALQAKTTATQGQAPFAVILSCMDSRGSPEILFDQGIGDIFSLRVAGNVISKDMLASLEYATAVVGSKIIVVMGHSHCGAVESACKNVQLGNITSLLAKIRPAVDAVKTASSQCDEATVNQIAKQNVLDNIAGIAKESTLIKNLLTQKKIAIVGAFQDLNTGKVTFFNKDRL